MASEPSWEASIFCGGREILVGAAAWLPLKEVTPAAKCILSGSQGGGCSKRLPASWRAAADQGGSVEPEGGAVWELWVFPGGVSFLLLHKETG